MIFLVALALLVGGEYIHQRHNDKVMAEHIKLMGHSDGA